MAKKKYVKPVMVTEEFVPNEYCKVCGITVGSTLTATCGGNNMTMYITSLPGASGEITAEPTITGGQSNGQYGSGTLYPDQNNPSTYVLIGTISLNHTHPMDAGEYIELTQSLQAQGKKVGDYDSNGRKICSHDLASDVSHHHLENVKIYTNHS